MSPTHDFATHRRSTWLIAIMIALVLTAGRAIGDWPHLSVLQLPDNDDMMRLAEVRDWFHGQAFRDLVQHRLGIPPGASMHWSRIADLGPTTFLWLLAPLIGERSASLAMIVGYQGLLLLAYLLLAARNARWLIGARAMPYAVIFAALAFPTVSLFVPGRIDHHGLQIGLTMIVVGAIVAPPSWRVGCEAGSAAALSLAIGLEVAPELIAAFIAIGLRWLTGGSRETPRLAGIGLAMGILTTVLLLFTRPDVWPVEWCDGFTPASTRATLGASLALAALALSGVRWIDPSQRLAAAIVAGALLTAWVSHASRVCLMGPYGALDPFLKRAFMDNIGEAKDLFVGQNSPGLSIAYGGLSLASLIPLAIILRDPKRRISWWPFALFLVISVAALIAQIRVSYVVAGIATLPFVALMTDAQAREGNVAHRLLLWIAGAGMTYNLAAGGIDRFLAPPPLRQATRAAKQCLDSAPLIALGKLPRGAVMAPLDSGGYVIGMTPHRSFGAVYHRNNAGNLATYRFFLSSPDRAAVIARRLNVDYVVMCESSLHESYVDALRHGSLIETLQDGRTPAWLQRIIHEEGGMSVYRVR